ncbi:TPR and ankyrin repeat-containing protein 1 [Symbiodinium microadriaticum]|uniref:TPR and ankyrin repeat-containing protein 1 n=1 Tax=Symbiodinium microadriaticum TaxID=2951 RepID=A0A1Q9DWQ8_SYMMI|nr:TPR and ankyrin repeat-containing protein 1 [Symbiodinium microadriaticum]
MMGVLLLLQEVPWRAFEKTILPPPYRSSGMSIAFAQSLDLAKLKAVHSRGTAGAVLEFGAKQVVLVWSEAKKLEMQERLPQSLVMTVQDCKGLEFFDVLMLDPFSDMAKDTSESQATQLWNLVFGFMETSNMEASQI